MGYDGYRVYLTPTQRIVWKRGFVVGFVVGIIFSILFYYFSILVGSI